MVAKQLHIFAKEVVLSGLYCQKAKETVVYNLKQEVLL